VLLPKRLNVTKSRSTWWRDSHRTSAPNGVLSLRVVILPLLTRLTWKRHILSAYHKKNTANELPRSTSIENRSPINIFFLESQYYKQEIWANAHETHKSLWQFLFANNLGLPSPSISSQFTLLQSKNRQKSLKINIFRVQGQSRLSMFIFLRSLSPVLVMIGSMSVPICNYFHARQANSGYITTF